MSSTVIIWESSVIHLWYVLSSLSGRASYYTLYRHIYHISTYFMYIYICNYVHVDFSLFAFVSCLYLFIQKERTKGAADHGCPGCGKSEVTNLSLADKSTISLHPRLAYLEQHSKLGLTKSLEHVSGRPASIHPFVHIIWSSLSRPPSCQVCRETKKQTRTSSINYTSCKYFLFGLFFGISILAQNSSTWFH